MGCNPGGASRRRASIARPVTTALGRWGPVQAWAVIGRRQAHTSVGPACCKYGPGVLTRQEGARAGPTNPRAAGKGQRGARAYLHRLQVFGQDQSRLDPRLVRFTATELGRGPPLLGPSWPRLAEQGPSEQSPTRARHRGTASSQTGPAWGWCCVVLLRQKTVPRWSCGINCHTWAGPGRATVGGLPP